MRTFGNQFGNSLYDKGKNHHAQPHQNQNYQSQQEQPPSPQNQKAYQQPTNPNQPPPQSQNHLPQDYASLYNLGLTIIEQGNSLVIIGDDIFSKRDSIKACGFRWDSNSKMWYKPLQQQAA